MQLTWFWFLLAFFIVLALLFVRFRLSFRSSRDREKRSPFECGFDPKRSARLPFSLRFFLLAVIFLVFDIEIALLLPLPLGIVIISREILLVGFIFFVILLLGVIHEWNQGSLSWAYGL